MFEIKYNTLAAKQALGQLDKKEDIPLVRFEEVGEKVAGKITAGRYVQVPVFGEFDSNGKPVTESKVQFQVQGDDGQKRAITILHTELCDWVDRMQPNEGDEISIELVDIERWEIEGRTGRTFKFEASLNGMWS